MYTPVEVWIQSVSRDHEAAATASVTIATLYGMADGCVLRVEPMSVDGDGGFAAAGLRPQSQPPDQDRRTFVDVPLDIGWNLISVRCGEAEESTDRREVYRAATRSASTIR
jgi:hypothetical protein